MALTKSELQKFAKKTSPSQYMAYREFLAELFRQAKAADESLTYARFAELLGFPPSNVIDHIIKGRRPLSLKNAGRIAESLRLSAKEQKYLFALVEYLHATSIAKREAALSRVFDIKEKVLPDKLSKLELEYFTAWYHPVIGEMTRLPEFESDPQWIADHVRPRIRPEQARRSLELLERLGIIVYDKKRERYVRTAKDPSTGPETTGHAVRGYHEEMLEVAKFSLTEVVSEGRDVSALTLCLDAAAAAKIKDIIRKLQREALGIEGEVQEPTQVYQVNVQLFPTTK